MKTLILIFIIIGIALLILGCATNPKGFSPLPEGPPLPPTGPSVRAKLMAHKIPVVATPSGSGEASGKSTIATNWTLRWRNPVDHLINRVEWLTNWQAGWKTLALVTNDNTNLNCSAPVPAPGANGMALFRVLGVYYF